MKKIFLLLLLSFSFSAPSVFAATPKKSTILPLDLKESKLNFGGRAIPLKEGQFEIKKGTIVGGKVSVDLQPLFPNLIIFTLKKFTELKTFAPGMPNAVVQGTLVVEGKSYPVNSKCFYKPTDTGFEADGSVKNGQFKVELHVVAKK